MNINYYRREDWVSKTFSKKGRFVLSLLFGACIVGILATGCSMIPSLGNKEDTGVNTPVADVADTTSKSSKKDVSQDEVNITISDENSSQLIGYDVVSVGRANPFMPYGELKAYEAAKQSALKEAREYNAGIAELKKLKNTKIRPIEDTNFYNFNLPVPPTSLAPEDSTAATITRTKVVGIMYNKKSPSAIISLDEKDYLVRQGDKILDNRYKVMQINPSWITVSYGSNIYSAGIGEVFAEDDLNKTQNDLYDLKHRFGGRRS